MFRRDSRNRKAEGNEIELRLNLGRILQMIILTALKLFFIESLSDLDVSLERIIGQ